MMKLRNNLFDILAFLLTAFIAFKYDWQANELCWGLWISSLLTGWAVILSSILRTFLHLAGAPILRGKELGETGNPLSAYFRSKKLPQKKNEAAVPSVSLSPFWVALGILGIGVFTWFHFTMFHSIQGALMSVFLRMEPFDLFGPNGFINASPQRIIDYLVTHYWAMILGTFIVRRRILWGGNPGINLKAIYQGVVKIHIFILLSAFLFFLLHFGIDVYERALLLILLFLFFFPIRIFRPDPSDLPSS
jgi:hypothetical protein